MLSVISHRALFTAAVKMAEHFGQRATDRALARAAELAELGDADGEAMWHLIAAAIDTLEAGPSGRVH